jgi:AraC-like DNA-binding protein
MSEDARQWLCDVLNACQALAVVSSENFSSRISALIGHVLSPPLELPGPAFAVARAVITEALAQLLRDTYLSVDGAIVQRLAIARTVRELGEELLRAGQRAATRRSLSGNPDHTSDRRVRMAMEYIARQLASAELSVETVSRYVGLSSSQTNRLFVREHGTRVRQFIRDRRLDSARQTLLMRPARVKEVCFMHGYATVSSFCRGFRSRFGYSPGSLARRPATVGVSPESKHTDSSHDQ